MAAPQTNLEDDVFNYEEVKNNYLEQIERLFRGQSNKPYTRESIKRMIKAYLEGQIRLADKLKLTLLQSHVVAQYEVVMKNGENVLIVKRLTKKDPIRPIIPYEDSFEIITKAHLETGHGDFKEVVNSIREHYVINHKCLELVLELCNVCAKRKQVLDIIRIKYNHACYIFVASLTVSSANSSPFKYLLIVVDQLTHFIHLRPLTSYDTSDVAVELLKIFMDFGPPRKIVTNDIKYFLEVTAIIKSLSPDCSVTVEKPLHQLKDWLSIVTPMIQDWMKKTGSTDWVMGCHMVQWKMNNTFDKEIKDTPYHEVFKNVPSDLLGPNPVWRSVSSMMKKKSKKPNYKADQLSKQTKLKEINEKQIISRNKKEASNEIAESIVSFEDLFDLETEDESSSKCDEITNSASLHSVEVSSQVQSVTSQSLPDKARNAGLEIAEGSFETIGCDAKLICHCCNLSLDEPHACDECFNVIHKFCAQAVGDSNPELICHVCLERRQRLIDMKRKAAEVEQKMRESNILRS